jgi:cholesterol transport system auxiliary component
VLLAGATLAACSSLGGSRQGERYFVLDAPPAAASAPLPVAVSPTTAARFYDTQDIVYSRTPGTRAYYRFSHWTERPQRAVQAQLALRLASPGTPVRALLATHVEEIYHDAGRPPGTARLVLAARLVDPATGTVIASRRFSRSAAAASHDAPGAVAGMRVAMGALLDDVAAWVASETPGQ